MKLYKGEIIVCVHDVYSSYSVGNKYVVYDYGGYEDKVLLLSTNGTGRYITAVDLYGPPVINGKRSWVNKERVEYFITLEEFRDRKLKLLYR
jgi:hypothetical protein